MSEHIGEKGSHPYISNVRCISGLNAIDLGEGRVTTEQTHLTVGALDGGSPMLHVDFF